MKETVMKILQSHRNFIPTVNPIDTQQLLVDNVAHEKMSRSEGQVMEDVESTGSVPSPEATATKGTPASISRMLRTNSVYPKPRYTSLGAL